MRIKRDIEKELAKASKETPVVAILGPRQSGKTTLAQHMFPNHTYVNLEDLEMRSLALADPKGFLEEYPSKAGIILDEVQHVPELFSYAQVISDKKKQDGYFILTGSQNFTLNEGITQSLAGRVSQLTLLPLSINELNQANLLPDRIEDFVYKGCYPKLYASKVPIAQLYKNYINTYIQKDIKQIANIKNLVLFTKFVKSCAARSGQLLNLSSIGDDLGIAHSTVSEWISLLVASYIVFLLEPYNRKITKRLVKAPKIYFYDTGLACSLLNIKSPKELSHSYLKGSLIETCIVSDLYKQYCNLDFNPEGLHFWRTYDGNEVDAVIDKLPHPIAIEVKAGKTVTPDFFKGLQDWQAMTKTPNSSNFVIYGGLDTQKWPNGTILSWQSSGQIVKDALGENL